MELGRGCEYSGMHLFYAQLLWESPVGIRFLIALVCLSTTTCVLAQQQQPQREVRRQDGRVSVAVSPAMVQRLAELLGKQSEELVAQKKATVKKAVTKKAAAKKTTPRRRPKKD
jgi:hypothetical protein